MKECVLGDPSEQDVCSAQAASVVGHCTARPFFTGTFLYELQGPERRDRFNNAVKDLQSIPYILLVEIGGIFIPLIYHAVYGLVITVEARPNNLHYPYPRNWFYLIQRITGSSFFSLSLFTCSISDSA